MENKTLQEIMEHLKKTEPTWNELLEMPFDALTAYRDAMIPLVTEARALYFDIEGRYRHAEQAMSLRAWKERQAKMTPAERVREMLKGLSNEDMAALMYKLAEKK